MFNSHKDNDDENIDDVDVEFYNDDTREVDSDETEGDFAEAAEAKLKKLRQKLKDCEREKIEYLTGWQRTKADFVNLKKRSTESSEKSVKQAKENTLSAFFPVIDSFEMAMTGEAWEQAGEKWQHGLSSIYNQFVGILTSQGIEMIEPLGAEFDPYIHTSVATQETDEEAKDNKVAAVLQRGYQLQSGEVVRSPKVVVFSFKR